MMESANVSKSILSVSSPGINLVAGNDELARHLCRSCNSFAASLKKEYPDKFGFWATLPLPDIDASFKEMETALAEGADGFALLTNYHGNYVGSPVFDPIFDRLNELKANVFIHPTTPCIKCSEETIKALPFGTQYPVPMFEFLFDTARGVMNLFLTGTVERCPNIKFIIPHVGGCFPPLITRFTVFSYIVPGGRLLKEEEVNEAFAKQFYFDLAGLAFAGDEGGGGQLKAFVEGYGISHKNLLYGSDFPFTPMQFVVQFAERMIIGLEELFTEEDERGAIYEGNAGRLLEKSK